MPRVLVVDDEENLRELVELTLVGMGLDVDTAPDLASARALIAQRRYALCLTDMRLPDGNGLELVAQMATEQADTPIAVITAFGSADNAVAALKAGAFDYLSKPVAVDALRSLVRSALNLSRHQGSELRDERGPRERAAERAGPERIGAERAGSERTSLERTGTERTGTERGGPERAGFERGDSGGRLARATGAGASAGARSGQRAISGQSSSQMIGASSAIDAVRASIARMTRSMAPVAITGESGSGKELAARQVHEQGARATGPFVAVNCGAIPENLMESEFFGYRKGAFTGADSDRAGFFAAASGGTLFLDEVADLPLAMQVKLLRAIQEKRVRRVGAVVEEPVDVRIISATHQDLARCVAEGRFRQDLYYRLNVIELRMPSLRERREDIPVLAEAILTRLAERNNGQPVPRLSSVTTSFLQRYDFPGNVRELENILERALAFSDGRVINVEDLGLRPSLAGSTELAEPASAAAIAAARAAAVDTLASFELAARAEPVATAGPPNSSELAASAEAAGRPEPVARGEAEAGVELLAGAEPPAGTELPARVEPSLRAELSARTELSATGEGLDDGRPAALLDPDGVPRSLPDYLLRIEREAIERALVRTGNNRTAAARELGITFRALRHRMQRLGMS